MSPKCLNESKLFCLLIDGSVFAKYLFQVRVLDSDDVSAQLSAFFLFLFLQGWLRFQLTPLVPDPGRRARIGIALQWCTGYRMKVSQRRHSWWKP